MDAQASLHDPNAQAHDAFQRGLVPLRFIPTRPWAFAMLALSLICVATLSYGGTREFIYYQF